MNLNNYFTVSEVANILECTTDRVRYLLSKKRLPGYRHKRKVYIPKKKIMGEKFADVNPREYGKQLSMYIANAVKYQLNQKEQKQTKYWC